MKPTIVFTGSLLAALSVDAASLSRQELEKKLQDLAKKPAPTKLAPGAMCYSRMAPADRHEYSCPTCGEKTLYSRSDSAGWDTIEALQSISHYRRLVKELKAKDLDCELDESAFCKKCGKDATKKGYALVVRLPDQKEPHRTTLRGHEDLSVLLDFLTNKDKHNAGPAGEQPLKDHLPRIRELLGIKESSSPSNKK